MPIALRYFLSALGGIISAQIIWEIAQRWLVLGLILALGFGMLCMYGMMGGFERK